MLDISTESCNIMVYLVSVTNAGIKYFKSAVHICFCCLWQLFNVLSCSYEAVKGYKLIVMCLCNVLTINIQNIKISCQGSII